MTKYKELVTKLKEIFQIDRPELDFGVYRILNQRSDEINEFLEHRLQAKVKETFKAAKAAKGDGADDENSVYSHLLTFFSRYYDEGDFISQRRYKGDTYAIPYAGEEVMLHWANKDQYYIKSGENFSNYRFKLADGRSVFFKLISADTAKDNRKDNDNDRCFVFLAKAQTITKTDDEGEEYEETITPIEEIENASGESELIIHFEYKALPKGNKQAKLTEQAIKAIEKDKIVTARWLDLLNRMPTDKNPTRTLLEKELTHYTAKNTSDYFIHKDLGKFLRGELDFYIKNEVMHLDDVQDAEAFADIERNLRMIQCLRSIAQELINFLAQIEDFQKKLWLKKKFVVSSHYCITLDRVPEELYPEIANNKKQWQQWRDLGVWDNKKDGTVEGLKEQPFMMVDSSLFSNGFKEVLSNCVADRSNELNGTIINSDNFQALNLLKSRYRDKVDLVYIDPPYNTEGDGFSYKDNYKHSSWNSLIENRLATSSDYLSSKGILFSSINDIEVNNLKRLLDGTFGEDKFESQIIIQSNKRGQTYQRIAKTHEYLMAYAIGEHSGFNELPKDAVKNALSDQNGTYELWELRNRNPKFGKHNRPNLYYPIFVNSNSLDKDGYASISLEEGDNIPVYPKNSEGKDSCWRWGKEKTLNAIVDGSTMVLVAKQKKDGGWNIYEKARKNTTKAKTIWSESSVISEQGTVVLGDMGFTNFGFPKPVELIRKAIKIGSSNNSIVLDYFAGSGTTASAVIAENRIESSNRKYILIEQGEYLEGIIQPRIQKNIYSQDWKKGKPASPETGISHCFKVLKLESYEDALNNLELTQLNTDLFDTNKQLKDDYQINYMLDMESRGSLLSTDDFKKPFDYKMKIAVDSAGAFEEQHIDLVETFNYLIGLTVDQYDYNLKEGYVRVEGTLPTGEQTLVFWRDCEQIDYDDLLKKLSRFDLTPDNNPYDVIYINGDHNVPALYEKDKKEGNEKSRMKLRQIEPEFLSLMFDVEAV